MEQSFSSLSDYLNCSLNCACGHVHTTTLKHIEISEHAHHKLPSMLHQQGYKNVFLLADINTFPAAGNDITDILTKAHFNVDTFIFKDKTLVPNEEALGSLFAAVPNTVDLVIAVGSGTLNDLGKYLSSKLKLPYYVVATAPSMDGFASNVSCLILNNMKTTVETHIPEAIIADTNVLAAAPGKMIAAGVGDILGKYVCLLDWKLSHIINEEYHCTFVESMVRDSIQVIVDNIDLLQSKDLTAIENVMESLVLSGIAMSYIGNSRPASGSEHHLSHFWELNFLAADKPAVLHGIKVGIGTVEAIRLYELLLDAANKTGFPDFNNAYKHADTFSYEQWVSKIKTVYPATADEVIELEVIHQKNDPENVKKRLEIIEKKWPDIFLTITAYLPKTSTLVSMLKQAGAPTRPYEEDISAALVRDGVLYAKELRNRYGLLQLLYDLGYNETFAMQLELLWNDVRKNKISDHESDQIIYRR